MKSKYKRIKLKYDVMGSHKRYKVMRLRFRLKIDVKVGGWHFVNFNMKQTIQILLY